MRRVEYPLYWMGRLHGQMSCRGVTARRPRSAATSRIAAAGEGDSFGFDYDGRTTGLTKGTGRIDHTRD